MDLLALVARIVLAAVLSAAGVAKLLDRPGSVAAVRGFGVPDRFAAAAGTVLPVVELTCAALIVIRPIAAPGAIAATVLLLAMSAAISRLIAVGQAPPCHCFGALHSEPVGRATLLRSIALTVLAAIVAVQGPGSRIEAGGIGLEPLAPLLAAAGTVILAARTSPRGSRAGADGPPPGDPAPGFELVSAHDGRVSLQSLLATGRTVTLVFVDAGCGPCRTFLPALTSWQPGVADALVFAAIRRGGGDSDVGLDDGLGMPELIDESGDVFKAYGVQATPSAVTVAVDGRLASRPVAGYAAIEALIRLSLRETTPAAERSLSEKSPSARFP